jgi:predicted DNA-binding protein YlxM (UPF0122 family)
MEKIIEQGILYDFYGELLTEHQKKIYEAVVYNDLSLSEIAEDAGISRQGVHDLVKRCNKMLQDCEDKLHLIEKFHKTKMKVVEINQIVKTMEDNNHCLPIQEQHKLTQISQLAAEIIEEL